MDGVNGESNEKAPRRGDPALRRRIRKLISVEERTYGVAVRLFIRGKPVAACALLRTVADWAESIRFCDALVTLARTERLCGQLEHAVDVLDRAGRLTDLDDQDRCGILLERLKCALALGERQEAFGLVERLIRAAEDESLDFRFRVGIYSDCASALRRLGSHSRSREALALAIGTSKAGRLFVEPFVLDAFYDC